VRLLTDEPVEHSAANVQLSANVTAEVKVKKNTNGQPTICPLDVIVVPPVTRNEPVPVVINPVPNVTAPEAVKGIDVIVKVPV
jgi:hypothetical protein